MHLDGKPGNLNRNQQLLVAQTAWQGSESRHYIWVMQCMPCGHMYGADASEFFQRKCPACQDGPPGLVVKLEEEQPTASPASPPGSTP
jgi:hypothetical protein